MLEKGEGEGAAAEALSPVVKKTPTCDTLARGKRPGQGVEGLDRAGRRSRDRLRKTAVGTHGDRAGTHTDVGLLRH